MKNQPKFNAVASLNSDRIRDDVSAKSDVSFNVSQAKRKHGHPIKKIGGVNKVYMLSQDSRLFFGYGLLYSLKPLK